mmetsp:Transcript_55987/g.122376  ORF Transcript_55987/g.122376 Transcript_55987/m.122376 type:complete len:177 (-) Transcript_55987:312-842(-)
MDAFAYRTSNAAYGFGVSPPKRSRSAIGRPSTAPNQAFGTGEHIPTIAEILAERPRIKRPMTPTIDRRRFAVTRELEENLQRKKAQVTPSYSHVTASQFPPRETGMRYPDRQVHPLYRTTGMEYGDSPPRGHHMQEIWFPRDLPFTRSFTDLRPRDTGLRTTLPRSEVHGAFESVW